MSLLPGARLRGYEILNGLGAGGMGEVYRARDLTLNREVAIKVLPAAFAADPERVARFKREAQTLAALNHPHIAQIYGFEETDSLLGLVMELVEGEDLSVRLSRGALSPDAAISIARQIADALEAAHQRGIVHRDLKPANVKIRTDGTAKILDFGLAKAVSPSGEPSIPDALTLTSLATTEAGTILGTAAYMSPEQARGLAVDRRSDIWAFGLVLYEMLSGRRVFTGATASDLVAAVLRDDIDWSALPATTPAAVRSLLARCLERDVQQRLQRIGEARVALDAAQADFGRPSAGLRGKRSGRSGKLTRALLGGVVVIAIVVVAAWWVASRRDRGAAPPSTTTILAVLPIETLGGDSSAGYLADGMTGELARALSQLPKLQVVGDLSTFRFKGNHASATEIARQLGVGLLLTGKLQSRPGRVRLQMQLTDRIGTLLWSNTFDREDKDTFATEDEITAAVAGEMRMVLSPTTVAETRAGRTTSSAAHDLFLRGQFEKNRLTPEGLERALGFFQEALKLDPQYAQAYVGIAFADDMLADVYRPSHEYHSLALAAAKRAVEIDGRLAEAHVLHGFEIAAATWDFAAGRTEMERGLAMNPRSPDGLFMCAGFRFLTGDLAGSLALADRLIQVDPLSAVAARLRAEVLVRSGRYEEALRQDAVATKLDPSVILLEATKGEAFLGMGRLGDAEAAYLEFQRAFQQPSWGLAMTYARMGKRDDAFGVVKALEARAKQQWVDPTFIAAAWAAIGDRDRALGYLEDALQKKTFFVRAFLNGDHPWFANLRNDPRYSAFRRRVLTTTFSAASDGS